MSLKLDHPAKGCMCEAHARNREKDRQLHEKYRLDPLYRHKSRIRANAYYRRNKEIRLAYAKGYGQKHRQERTEYHRQYKIKFPTRFAASRRRTLEKSKI